MTKLQPLIINNWIKGVSDPNIGFSKLSNIQVDENMGSACPSYETIRLDYASDTIDFTADASTDICTASSAVSFIEDNVAVMLTTSGTLPAGLSTGTQYFINEQSSTTFKLTASVGGSPINITDAGTGVHNVLVTAVGDIKHGVEVPDKDLVIVLDNNGRVWVDQGITFTKTTSRFHLLNGNTLTSASGNGLAVFTNSDSSGLFLFVYRNRMIDVFDITTQAKRYDPVGTSSITNGWATMNTASGVNNSHYSIVGEDNIIYFCDDRFVGSIQEIPGQVFDPATSGTYNFNNQALDLIQNEKAEWIEELNGNLLIAGKTFDNIYPWNRRDDSFSDILKVGENGVFRLKNINDVVFILAGRSGMVRATQGVAVYDVYRFPDYLVQSSNSRYMTWGGVGIRNGELAFGVKFVSSDSSSGIFILKKTSEGYSAINDMQLSDSVNSIQNFITSSLNTLRNSDVYRFGGDSGYYVFYDAVSATRRASGTNAVPIIETELYYLAIGRQKGVYSSLEIELDRLPASGSIVVSARNSIYDTYIEIASFTLTNADTLYVNDELGLTDIVNKQFKIEVLGAGTDEGTVSLKELRLYP